ncbi:MAG: hypothetical protein ACP5EP_09765 [Acidobacteriaceae bacterium]
MSNSVIGNLRPFFKYTIAVHELRIVLDLLLQRASQYIERGEGKHR